MLREAGRSDTALALRWSEDAFHAAQGAATRLQWGATHVADLVELAPHDEARIERTVAQIFDEAAAQTDTFCERSARSLQRVGNKLAVWNQQRAHVAAVNRMQARLDRVCAKCLPATSSARCASRC